MEFIDYAAAGRVLLDQRDRDTWALGDLATDFEIKLGRPDDPDAPTLGDLAKAWNASRQRVSEWRSVSAFYPTDDRTFTDLSWEQYNMARRAANGSLDNALELLDHASRQHMTVQDFRRFLKGIIWEGELSLHDFPLRIQGLLPAFLKRFRVTVTRASED